MMKIKMKDYYVCYFTAAAYYLITVVKCFASKEFDTMALCVGTVMLCEGCAKAKEEKKN